MVVSTRGILAIGLGVGGPGLPGRPVPRSGSAAGRRGPQGGESPDAEAHAAASRSLPLSERLTSTLSSRATTRSRFLSKEFNAALLARKNELMKIMSEAQEEAQMLTKLTPGTEDYKKHENRVTELKARHEAGREQAQREFALRQAEIDGHPLQGSPGDGRPDRPVAQAELRPQGPRTSRSRGLIPNSVMAAISNTVVYADPANDITADVIFNLNRMYKATSGLARQAGGRRSRAHRRSSRRARLERRRAGVERVSAIASLGAQARNAQSDSSRAHARRHGRGARSRLLPRSRRDAAVSAGRGRAPGIVFERSDLPDRPSVRARVDESSSHRRGGPDPAKARRPWR